MDESHCAVSSGDGGERNSFRPAGGTVNHRKEVCVAGGRGERTNQINMKVEKSLGMDWDMLGRNFGMGVNFSSLTG